MLKKDIIMGINDLKYFLFLCNKIDKGKYTHTELLEFYSLYNIYKYSLRDSKKIKKLNEK